MSWIRNTPRLRMSVASLLTAVIVGGAEAGNPFGNMFRSDTSVTKLAKQLDKVEREFQYTGRVTVKAPDVWGQARLTRHREEFEIEMAQQLKKLPDKAIISAQIAVSDQAFLSQALALTAAANGNAIPTSSPQAIQSETKTTSQTAGSVPLTTAVAPTTQSATPSPRDTDFTVAGNLTPLPGVAAAGSSSTTTSTITQTTPFGLLGAAPDFFAANNLSIEPEILLDQQKRFLDHLHQIRRMNEGDDTADSPGYSLNLVRVPVSLLPGDHTRENYGAEVTLIAEPHVTEELLPTTFRELVINDLVDQLSLPIVKILDVAWNAYLEEETTNVTVIQDFEEGVQLVQLAQTFLSQLRPDEYQQIIAQSTPKAQVESLLKILNLNYGLPTEDILHHYLTGKETVERASTVSVPYVESVNGQETTVFRTETRMKTERIPRWAIVIAQEIREEFPPENNRDVEEPPAPINPAAFIAVPRRTPDQKMTDMSDVKSVISPLLTSSLDRIRNELRQRQNSSRLLASSQLATATSFSGIQTPRERRSRYPVSASAIADVFGRDEISNVTSALFAARDRFQCRDKVQLTDVQGFLRSELEFAYDYLNSMNQPTSQGSVGCDVWYSPVFPTAADIRNLSGVVQARESFMTIIPEEVRQSNRISATRSLAWAIAVESAILNQQLNEDLKQVSQDPGCGCAYGGPYIFYGPDPPPEARRAFVEYVKCRWPIRVFALDPVTQQQNVADAFSLRREGQLAVALAFQKGAIGAQSLTRYMRRIEQDLRTISLNNTHIGFGAGNDTFGWRFFPRVQTPDVESNIKTVGRDLIWGGPNRDARMKRWRIEPGMRECVALMIMPSFIKHVRFDVRTNWFKLVPSPLGELVKAGENGPTLKHTMNWSRELQAVEMSMMECLKDEHLYRPGEVERLVKRGRQLSQQMPINTMYAQVPYENTLGGFEMFSSGVTDLAPELVGFYGAPGIDPDQDTTLFLVGDNFSVHNTEIIAGNLPIEKKLMLSREVMQITIPAGVKFTYPGNETTPPTTVTVQPGGMVDVPAGTRTEPRIQPRIVFRRSTPATQIAPADVPVGANLCNDPYVEIRLATAYGVSSPLYVPAILKTAPAAPTISSISPAPGISNTGTSESTLFIQGTNFVSGQTRLIVGNRAVDGNKLDVVSDRILRATVAAPVNAAGERQNAAEVQVATPNGLSNVSTVQLVGAAKASPTLEQQVQTAVRDALQKEQPALWTFDLSPSGSTLELAVTWNRPGNEPVAVHLTDYSLQYTIKAADSLTEVLRDGQTKLQGELAGWLIASDTVEKQPIGPISFTEGEWVKLETIVDDPRMLQFLTLLQSRNLDVKEIQFVGFIRIPKGTDTQTLKLKDPITFTVKPPLKKN